MGRLRTLGTCQKKLGVLKEKCYKCEAVGHQARFCKSEIQDKMQDNTVEDETSENEEE